MDKAEISREKVDRVLFKFLQSVYLFEKREMSLFGISWDEVYLLQLLARHSRMRVSELAAELKVKAFTASRMITKLCNQRFVERNHSTDDNRVIFVSLTSLGRHKINQIEEYNYEVVCSRIEMLKDIDINVLMRSIEKLDDFLGLTSSERSSSL